MLLRPEADPAVLLAWIENEMDLANVHRAARVREDTLLCTNLLTPHLFLGRTHENLSYLSCVFLQSSDSYSITVSQEFANEFWKKELTQV